MLFKFILVINNETICPIAHIQLPKSQLILQSVFKLSKMSIQKTFLHYTCMLCIRIVPFQTVEILFGLVNMSIDYITLKLKKNHSLSQPHFYKRNIQLKRESEIKNELIDLRSKVSSSIFAGSRAWTYLGYIILVTLSV